ncbi:hypothetical protein KI387_001912, partial [Taxus chinensis]
IYLFETFATLFAQVEQQLHKNEFPIYLFNNVVKRTGHDKSLRTCQSTFITTLKIEQTLKELRALLNETTE